MKCAYCGEEFQPKNKQQKYDKPGCGRLADRDRKRERKASGKGKYEFVCKGCGVTYHTDYKNRDQYCSRECAYSHIDEWGAFNNGFRPVGPPPRATIECKMCGKEVLRVEAISSTYCSEACKEQAYSGQCAHCGKTFIGRMPFAKYCSDECSYQALLVRGRENYEPVPKHRITCSLCGKSYLTHRAEFCPSCSRKRNRGNARQRAKRKGVKVKRFQEFSVFERDNWTCYICGAHTPKELRGTFEDNAPEIDHVIPLSKGGPHTPDNVRCCCRACNSAKGSKKLKDVRRQAQLVLPLEVNHG